jgi:hypothetical protein
MSKLQNLRYGRQRIVKTYVTGVKNCKDPRYGWQRTVNSMYVKNRQKSGTSQLMQRERERVNKMPKKI